MILKEYWGCRKIIKIDDFATASAVMVKRYSNSQKVEVILYRTAGLFGSYFWTDWNVENCIVNVAQKWYYSGCKEGVQMNKTISMSIRVSEKELDKLKKAAEIENYASYSEFIRRTALKEAEKVMYNKRKVDIDIEKH